MASNGISVFRFTVLCINILKSGGFVKVECKAENVGHYGQQSLLECVVKTSTDVTDPNIRTVAWKKLTSPEDEGDLVLGFHRGEFNQPKRGYRFAEPLWDQKNMNVSLLITNTAVADDGDYKCMVITDSGDDSMVTTLKVQAPEQIEILKIVVRLVVIGLLMVGLLCVLLFYRWRAQQVQKRFTEPCMVGHHAVYTPEVDL